MIKFLAIIAFCSGAQCGFWADTKTAYYSEKECKQAVEQAVRELAQQGVDPEDVIPGCIPIKFYQKEA